MAHRTAAVLRQMREAVGWIEADIEGSDATRYAVDRRERQLFEPLHTSVTSSGPTGTPAP